MQLLLKRILQDGKCYEGGILKVDSFINHQMDPILTKSIGVEILPLSFCSFPILHCLPRTYMITCQA